ncbi:hypothetical protein OAG68_01445 [bacterium]|nr:hypothetical protein [bacterium]
MLDLIAKNPETTQLVHLNLDSDEELMLDYWKENQLNCPVVAMDSPLAEILVEKAGADWGVPQIVVFTSQGELLTKNGRELVGSITDQEKFTSVANDAWAKIVDKTQQALRDRFSKQVDTLKKEVGENLYLQYCVETIGLDTSASLETSRTSPVFLNAQKKFVDGFQKLSLAEKSDVFQSVVVITGGIQAPEGGAHPSFYLMPELFFQAGAQSDKLVAKKIIAMAPDSLLDYESWPLGACVLGCLADDSVADKQIAAEWKEDGDASLEQLFGQLFQKVLGNSNDDDREEHDDDSIRKQQDQNF